MDHFYGRKLLGKVDHLYPNLCAPNDGYDENGRWMGMTPDEVARWLGEIDQCSFLRYWKLPERPE